MTYNQLSRDDVNKILKDLCIEVLDDYESTKKMATFRCLLCGETFKNKFCNVREWKGKGCHKCRGTTSTVIYTLEDRKNKKIQNILGRIDESLKFIDFTDDTLEFANVKCLICGELFVMAYSSIMRGSSHRPCKFKMLGQEKLLPISEIQQRMNDYGNDFSVDFSNYNSANSLLRCTCNTCGYLWDAKAKNLSRNRSCPNCARIKRNNSKKKSLEEYGNVLDSFNLELVGEYDCASSLIKVRCKKCLHEFETSILYLNNFGVGCIKCNERRRMSEKFSYFNSKITNIHIHIYGEFRDMCSPLEFYCDKCKKIFTRTPHDFIRSQNCPNCTTNSKMEYVIKNYLDDNNINHILHKTFDDLRGVNNGLLSYDFYIPEYNLLIEAQGEQREKPKEYFGGNEGFLVQQEHDRRKREYAGTHNIDLLEIWHWDYKNIEQILNEKFSKNNNQKSA